MLKPIPFANAVTVVGVGAYVVCRFVALVAPDLLFSVGKSWFHTFSMDSMRANPPFDMEIFLFGGVTLVILTWVTAYATAALYNKFAK